MKRFCIALGMILLFASLLPATAEAQGLRLGRLGVKAGYLLPKLSGSPDAAAGIPDIEYEEDSGFAVGLYLRGHLDNHISIQSEVLYLQRRTTSETQVGGATVANEIKASYIQVPVQLRFATNATGRVSPILFAGPAFLYRLDVSAEGGDDGLVDPRDIEDETKKTGLELVAGAGVEIGEFSLEARYTWGLRDFFADVKAADYKWRELGFFASYEF